MIFLEKTVGLLKLPREFVDYILQVTIITYRYLD